MTQVYRASAQQGLNAAASRAQQSVNVVAWRTFADHHAYMRDDIEDLRRWTRAQSPETVLVTTQKDLVKIALDRLGDRLEHVEVESGRPLRGRRGHGRQG